MSSDRFIRALLRLYPAGFRRRYGEALLQFHRERVREGLTSWALSRIVLDHGFSAAAEHLRITAEHAARMRTDASLAALLQDLRYGLRFLLRRPAFALVAIASIAIGVGANTAIFSVVHGILLRPLPYPHAERLVTVEHEAPLLRASEPEYLDYVNGLRSFEVLAAYTQSEGNLAADGEPERVALATVSRNFFDALAVTPALGRTFAAEEDLVAPAQVAVLSHALWQRRFGGDSAILGRTVALNGVSRTVVGIMPARFGYPTARTDLWLPLRRIDRDSLGHRANHFLSLLGRLKPGVPVDGAQREVRAVADRMVREHAESYDPMYPPTPVLTRVEDALLGRTRPFLWALFGTVGFVLLIVCANVANLLLARGEHRRAEMALRGALGASRTRLVTQLLAESGALAIAGGSAGLFLAWSSQRALLALAPASIPRLDEIGLDWVVLAYAGAISLAAGVLFGLVPAFRVSGAAPGEMLKHGGRNQRAGSSRSMRQYLVGAEVALAVILLSGAAMLLRSMINLQSARLGFDTESVLTAKVSLTPGSYDEARAARFYDELLERVRAIPAVRAVGAAGWLPVAESGPQWAILAEGQTYQDIERAPNAVPQQVTPGYFAALGIPLLSGRDFSEHDDANSPYVAIVSRSMAQQLWPGSSPLGKRFRLGGEGAMLVTVVGVVGDIRARGYDDTPEPTMYFPHPQTAGSTYFMPRSMSLVIRTAGAPLGLAPEVRAVVRSIDPDVPVSSVQTLDHVLGDSVASRRFGTTLIAAFAAIALLLAAIGIFGVVSYGVSERTYEIGIRVALGAERATILSLVISDSARVALAGIGAGLIGAVAAGRIVRSMLVGVPVIHLPTLLAVSAALGAVVLLATALPARRASTVDPVDALRAG